MFCSWRRRVLSVHVQKTGGSTGDVLMGAADPEAAEITDARGRRPAMRDRVAAVCAVDVDEYGHAF